MVEFLTIESFTNESSTFYWLHHQKVFIFINKVYVFVFKIIEFGPHCIQCGQSSTFCDGNYCNGKRHKKMSFICYLIYFFKDILIFLVIFKLHKNFIFLVHFILQLIRYTYLVYFLLLAMSHSNLYFEQYSYVGRDK